jgi:chaperonin GroES
MARKYKPLHENIIVRRTSEMEVSPGGIYIPEVNRDKPSEGVVLSVGSGYRTAEGTVLPLEVREGDLIAFGRYAGNDVKQNGEDVVILKEDEILATYTVDGEDEPIVAPKPVVVKVTGDDRLKLLAQTGAGEKENGLAQHATTATLRVVNEEQCDPPLADAEIEQLVEALFKEE